MIADKRIHLIFLSLFLVVGLASCNLPGVSSTPTADNQMVYTQAAQTVSAQLTEQSPFQPTEETPAGIGGTSVATLPPTATPSSTSEPTSTDIPTPTLEPTIFAAPTRPAEQVFKDDFSNDQGWYTEENERFGFYYEDETYRIYVNIRSAQIWSIREDERRDVILEVDAARVEGPEDGYFGLVCRQMDDENYYALVIGSDGFYGILKMEDGEDEFIGEGVDRSSILNSGTSVNRLRAECIGDSLTLFVNDVRMLEVNDDDISSGVVGLLAGTRRTEGVVAAFDNFAIFRPK